MLVHAYNLVHLSIPMDTTMYVCACVCVCACVRVCVCVKCVCVCVCVCVLTTCVCVYVSFLCVHHVQFSLLQYPVVRTYCVTDACVLYIIPHPSTCVLCGLSRFYNRSLSSNIAYNLQC